MSAFASATSFQWAAQCSAVAPSGWATFTSAPCLTSASAADVSRRSAAVARRKSRGDAPSPTRLSTATRPTAHRLRGMLPSRVPLQRERFQVAGAVAEAADVHPELLGHRELEVAERRSLGELQRAVALDA